ncbi:MAG: hypothetical protein V1694_08665 [Candidatus Eisenbacteria bacterium]
MSFSRVATALVVLSICFAFNALASDKLVTIDSPYWSAVKDAAEAIEAYGGHAKFVIPPHFIIADIPDGAEAALIAASPITAITDQVADPADFAAYGKAAEHVIAAWNNVFKGKAAQAGLEEDPSPDRLPLINDAAPFDKYVLPLKPPGAKYYDVSEFMLGTVMVGIILPESNGTIDPNTENWTTILENEVTSEVIGGLNWYYTKKEWRALTFYTVFNYAVPTGYEPISRSSGEESYWQNQCLGVLGYTNGYPGYGYVNALRDSAGTDWATLVWVVNSLADGDGMFSDGRFGYSTLGGPKTVMTYDNDGWGIANMDAVIAHEVGHSFYALDEYQEAGHGCTETCGYLNIENQNSEYPGGPGGCLINVRYCIMRSVQLSVARVCNYTKGHLGWNDTDNDSIADVNDTFPETVLNPYSPDPCSTSTPTFSGSASVTKLTNLNPYGKGNEITLNVISKVEWRVDSEPWQDAIPTDGAWGGGSENYYFTAGPLGTGPHVFEARAYHSYGNIDLTPAVDTLTIELASGVGPEAAVTAIRVNASPNPFGTRVEITYSVPGEYGKALPASMRVYDVKGRQVATLMEEMRSPGPGRLAWDGNAAGRLAPSGIYFIEFIAGDSRVVSKLVLTR